ASIRNTVSLRTFPWLAPSVFRFWFRIRLIKRLSPRASCSQVGLALVQAFEKFVTFTAAAHQDVFVFQHGLDDPQDRFRPQIIGAIKTVDGLEYLFLGSARIFQCALLEPVAFHEI